SPGWKRASYEIAFALDPAHSSQTATASQLPRPPQRPARYETRVPVDSSAPQSRSLFAVAPPHKSWSPASPLAGKQRSAMRSLQLAKAIRAPVHIPNAGAVAARAETRAPDRTKSMRIEPADQEPRGNRVAHSAPTVRLRRKTPSPDTGRRTRAQNCAVCDVLR